MDRTVRVSARKLPKSPTARHLIRVGLSSPKARLRMLVAMATAPKTARMESAAMPLLVSRCQPVWASDGAPHPETAGRARLPRARSVQGV